MFSIPTLAAADPVAHVINHKAVATGDGFWIWSSAQTNMILTAIIMLVFGTIIAKAVATGDEAKGFKRWITENRFAHMIEVICAYLKENTIRPMLGERTDRFTPFLWTLFFFILINNLIGLVPLLDMWHLANPDHKAAHIAWIGGTATQSIWVTGALAVICALVINYAGIKALGLKGYFGHMTGGVPLTIPFIPIVLLVFAIELLGTLIKPTALAIRLFANMTAGHILVAVLLGLAGATGFGSDNLALGIPVGIVSTVGTIAIYFLEIFVAFLQAYVFMFLTVVFISLLEHHDDHEHDHQPAHELAQAGLA